MARHRKMDDVFASEILATCDSIGYADKDKYYKDPEAFICVNDLYKYLKQDDFDHSVRRLLGQSQVVQRDLLPLIKHYSDDLELYDMVLRLLVLITNPALEYFDYEIPKNKKYLTQYLEMEGYLRSYKEAFVDKLLWKRLTDRLRHLLNLEWEKFMESDKKTLHTIVFIIQNILMVSADPREEQRTDDENSLHDRVLMVMHLSGIEDLLLFMASSSSMKAYGPEVLKVISLMLREQTGEQIAKTQLTRNEEEREKDKKELERFREKEMALQKIHMQKLPTRHSRFGGTFTVRDMKAPSGRDLLCHKPITSTADLSLDSTKKIKKVGVNRRPMYEDDPTRRSTVAIRIILKEFCAEFLDVAYNTIMRVVKDDINRGGTRGHGETYYLWAMKFFMEFNRFHKFKVSYVSETMSTSTFHYIQTLLDNYHGMMVTDKEKIPHWSKRAHAALNTYEELLFNVLWMDKYGNETVKESARVIKSNIFYLPEYRELCFGLLNTYDEVKLSRLYLKDLIETNHLFLKMLEDFSSSSRRILVKTKGKKRRKATKSKKTKKSRNGPPKTEEELEELWTTISDEISTALEPSELPDREENAGDVNVIPFDAASDIPIDEQKTTAVERIAVFLHTKKFKEAVTLLRASREVWPESKEDFGELGMDLSDEILVLKSIFLEKASLPAVTTALRDLENEDVPDDNNEEDEEAEFDDEEEEEEVRETSKEQEFDFFGFVLKYAAPKIVCNYAKLFKDWESLKPFTLHCVMKMFHRFVFQMEMPALICQASIFRTFQKILEVADHQSDLKDIKKFFYHFWPKFVKLCENKTMFVEILFWKTAREAQEIQEGYGSNVNTNNASKPSKSSWTTDEENELVLLAEEYSVLPDEAKRATKMVEWIKERWTWQPKSKKMMMTKLSEKGLIDNISQLKNRRAPKTWQDSEVEKLRELYEEFKDSMDIMGNILNGMEMKRSKNKVIQKMLEIGLIEDKNEVKKKRVRGQRGTKTSKKRTATAPGSSSDVEDVTREENTENGRSSRASRSSSESGSESDRSNSDSESDNANNTLKETTASKALDSSKSIQFGKEIVAEGMTGPIRWVYQSLKYFFDDLMDDPDSDENVPLVPIGSECISALTKSNMKAFLKTLGLQPPGAQETFWRIPGAWNQKGVKSRIDVLEAILKEADLVVVHQTVETADSVISNLRAIVDSDSDEEPTSRVGSTISRTASVIDNNSDQDSSIPKSQTNGSSQKSQKLNGKTKSRINSGSSSSEDESVVSSVVSKPPKRSQLTSDSEGEGPSGKEQNKVKTKKNRSRIVLDSDSDDDSGLISSGLNKSDAENSPVKKGVKNSRIDSDDDDDEGKEKDVTVTKSKPMRIVDSDDD